MKKAIIVFGLVFGLSVNAAQTAKVVVENANVYDKPQADSSVVGTVPKDASISVSNVPTNGFFKSRIPSGVIGWISGSDILAAGVTPGAKTAAAVATKNPKDSNYTSAQSRLLISGGLQTLNNTGFPSGISVTNSKSGYGGAIEMQFKINENFYWGGRAEYLLSSSSQAVSSTINQTFSFHTLPVMAGIMYVPIHKQKFRLGVGLYAGLSMMTSLTIAQSTTLSSATVTYTSTDICEMGNLQGSYSISSSLGILADVGYRMQSASYPASTSLNVEAFKANFGGLVTRLGVEIKL